MGPNPSSPTTRFHLGINMIQKIIIGRGDATIDVPYPCSIMAVGYSDGFVCLWYSTTSDPADDTRLSPKVAVVPTGADAPEGMQYVGTAISGRSVVHVYVEHILGISFK